jgi:hypothetical protein
MPAGPGAKAGEGVKFNRALLLSLAIAATVSAASPAFAGKKTAEPIKVFIFTAANEGGFVDPGQKQRIDSVEDLKKALEKKDLVQIVGQREGADITLEVLGRGGEETGSATTSRGPYGTWNTSKDTVATVRVGLRAGTYSTLVEGHNDGRITNVWRTAANNAAKRIENWIKDNHDNLIARRVQK